MPLPISARGEHLTRALLALMLASPASVLAQASTPASNPRLLTATPPAIATAGIVSSAHPVATRAGVDVLAGGGNAFDAAVAVAAALNVVEPMMSGMGGYGAILIYDARARRVRYLDASGRIPLALEPDVFRPPTPHYQENRRGVMAIATPSNLHAWETLWHAYGSRLWGRLFEPAIHAADSGYVLSERQAAFLAKTYSGFPTHAQAIYGRDGRPLQAGDRLVQHDLARSLRLVARQGARAFYAGPLADSIEAAVRRAGGFLSREDLRRDRADWQAAVSLQYRGSRVWVAGPPTNGYTALARLGMMRTFNPTALGHNTAPYLHRYAEITKLSEWIRLHFAADPDRAPAPIDSLLSAPVLASLAARVDTGRAASFPPPAMAAASGQHTTHFVVADQWGNVVSATQTLGNLYGSRVMPVGTGIWLNNSLAYSTFEPKGNPMDAFPGRRKLASFAPAIVTRDGRPWLAIGTPGGHTIPQSVPQMIMNVLDFGMDVQQAIAAPRIAFLVPDTLLVEPGIPDAVRAELTRRGHRLVDTPAITDAHGLTIDYDQHGKPARFTGGSDPRGEGLAEGISAP